MQGVNYQRKRVYMFSSTLKKVLLLFTLLVSFAGYLLASPEEILEYEFHDKSLRTKALQPRTQGFERLEFLGDRVLGLATAHLLYKNFPFNEIAWLTKSFETIVSNPSLFKIYQDFNIDSSELASSSYNAPLSGIAQKTASDIVESLIGAIYLEGGYAIAQASCEQLIKRYYNFTPQKGSTPITTHSLLSALSSKSKNHNQTKKFDPLQESLSYNFNDENLLSNAFRHPSVGGRVFKTLDFLGVRVLGLVVAEKVYNEHPAEGEGLLMQSFERIINNENIEKVFQNWQLWRYLEKQQGTLMSSFLNPERVSTRVAVETVRTFIGGVYLDGGWDAAQSVAHKLLFSNAPEDYIQPTPNELFEKALNWGLSKKSKDLKPQGETSFENADEWPNLTSKKTTKEVPKSSKEQPVSVIQNPLDIHPSTQLSYRQALEKKRVEERIHKKMPKKQEEWPALGGQKQNQSKVPAWPSIKK